MGVESYPPTLRRKKRIIPILLCATFNAISDTPLRAINANHRIGGLRGRTHNLAHLLAAIPSVNLGKTTIPTMKLPEEKTSNSNDDCDHSQAGETHPTALGQTCNGDTSQQKNC